MPYHSTIVTLLMSVLSCYALQAGAAAHAASTHAMTTLTSATTANANTTFSTSATSTTANAAANLAATAHHFPYLTVDSTIDDVLKHPAFAGFSRYILPLEWGYEDDMPLSSVARLLPYHNYINAEQSVADLNRMIDLIAAGKLTYINLEHEDAGLFFFRGKADSPFAVVCLGGGFSYVGSIHEGFPHALELSAKLALRS